MEMTKLAISEARKELNTLPKRLEKEHDAIEVTQNGKSVMAIMDWDFFETVMESLEILSDDKLLAQVKLGVKEIEAGKGIAWEKAKKELRH
ncbi:MAG: type II toxin-antitoxin system Phd/YefM family antitoxin [Candidatus Firestonebacteria bacterium]|nr:type II toxin-antitoxin system Phd/YefM family antitoxin [Candidatus Firestonebacteria bacterium]